MNRSYFSTSKYMNKVGFEIPGCSSVTSLNMCFGKRTSSLRSHLLTTTYYVLTEKEEKLKKKKKKKSFTGPRSAVGNVSGYTWEVKQQKTNKQKKSLLNVS